MREGWKEVEFGEIVEFPPKVKLRKSEKYPFIPMEEINERYKYVYPKIKKELSSGGAKFEEGDTLFSRITPCLQNGKIAQAKNLDNSPGFGSTEYFVFRGIENLTDSDFIYYLSITEEFRKNAINSMVGASGRQRADAGHIKKFKFLLPPLETQRKIAKILSNYDDLIENNLKRIKILEEMAQQTYEEWFVRMRFPGHESATINPETGLPEGWEKVKLGEVCNFSQGLQVPIEKQFTQFSNELIRFIRIVDVTQNTNDIRYIESPKSLNQFVHFKDVFMVRYGAPQVVTNYHGIIANNFFRININDENKLKRKFLFSFLNRNEIKENLLAMSVSATMPAISFKSFSTLDIILPEIEVQAKFHKYVDTTYDLILNLQNQNQRLREARDILLPRLMMVMVEV
jgi:type I restriction enzyme S subunit